MTRFTTIFIASYDRRRMWMIGYMVAPEFNHTFRPPDSRDVKVPRSISGRLKQK
ncbi:hypothetical protein PM082_019197 [Marasmius tenuissimus]|nr:hypothetical protein PM082_019197 [Marasmius tenuissimus]